MQSEFHRDEAARHIADEHRDGEGRDARRTFGQQNRVLVFERLQAADAAADDGAKTMPVDLLHVDGAILHRHFGRGHREVRVAIGPPDVFGILKIILRFELAHFTRDLAIVGAGVERRDAPDPADTVLQIAPEGIELLADGCDCTHAGDDDSTIRVHRSSLARSHSHALHGLE